MPKFKPFLSSLLGFVPSKRCLLHQQHFLLSVSPLIILFNETLSELIDLISFIDCTETPADFIPLVLRLVILTFMASPHPGLSFLRLKTLIIAQSFVLVLESLTVLCARQLCQLGWIQSFRRLD